MKLLWKPAFHSCAAAAGMAGMTVPTFLPFAESLTRPEDSLQTAAA